ncbi:DUF4192 domain-containing protein [Terrabacter sp. BE26]|uniref:DUF4192 domain-containing protein n=1 Tax=Terrabacter sp. BE26 TaxID=2898152 RepID=UPI0035BE9EB2
MPKISLSGPAELLTIIPFHLGFQPVRSVVVVCFHGKRLGLVARLDIVGAELAVEAASQTAPTLLRGKPSSVALVAFEDVPDESLPLLEALTDVVEWDRVVVRERLLVRGGRWRSVGCDCCPDEGWLLPEQADVPAVADYVALGHAVLSDRDDLTRLVEPLARTSPGHDLALAGVDDWQQRYAAYGGMVSRAPLSPDRRGTRPRTRGHESHLTVVDGGDPAERRLLITDSLSAWAGVLHGDIEDSALPDCVPSLVGPLRDLQFRDALIGWLCPGAVPLDGFPDELVVLLQGMLGPSLQVSPAGDGSHPSRPSGGSSLGAESQEGPAARGTGGSMQPDPDVEMVRALQDLLAIESARSRDDGLDAWSAEAPADPSDPSDDRSLEGWHEVMRKLEALGALEALAAFDETDEVDQVDLVDELADLDDAEAVDEWEQDDELGGLDGWDEALAPRLLLARLEQVCRLTPAAHAAPLLSVVASVAWWCGDGARSGVAVDRALELEPQHRLCRLVRQSLDHGIRPPRCA